MPKPRGWHSRGYLPHFDGGVLPQTVTFRLAGTLPARLVTEWRAEFEELPPDRRPIEEYNRIQRYLDQAARAKSGPAWLAVPAIAESVQDAILYFDSDRYHIHAWVLMPNHLHAAFTPCGSVRLGDIVATWKKYTARRANELLGRTGAFWQEDYFDRYLRSEQHLNYAVEYIEGNPVKAGLCRRPEDWPWSSARLRSSDA